MAWHPSWSTDCEITERSTRKRDGVLVDRTPARPARRLARLRAGDREIVAAQDTASPQGPGRPESLPRAALRQEKSMVVPGRTALDQRPPRGRSPTVVRPSPVPASSFVERRVPTSGPALGRHPDARIGDGQPREAPLAPLSRCALPTASSRALRTRLQDLLQPAAAETDSAQAVAMERSSPIPVPAPAAADAQAADDFAGSASAAWIGNMAELNSASDEF